MMRRMLRSAIRALQKGENPPEPQRTAEGLIPTNAGDVILRAGNSSGNSNGADGELQRELGRKVGDIVIDTMALRHGDRQVEIERRVGRLFV